MYLFGVFFPHAIASVKAVTEALEVQMHLFVIMILLSVFIVFLILSIITSLRQAAEDLQTLSRRSLYSKYF